MGDDANDSPEGWSEERLLWLWGKSDAEDPENWHPLPFHLLDVGNVCRALWDRALPEALRGQIAAALGLEGDRGRARRLVILLAAQHDLGKASSFQTKVDALWQGVRTHTGLDLDAGAATPPHGFVTTKVLPDLAEAGVGGWSAPRPAAKLLARITGGHHGVFPTGIDLHDRCMPASALGSPAWDAARAALLEAVARHLFDQDDAAAAAADAADAVRLDRARLSEAALVPLVGGLIAVADWIGSSQDFFPPARASVATLAAYARESRQRADAALRAFGWTGPVTFHAPTDFGGLFREAETQRPFVPNPMQQRVAWCADEQGERGEPYLLLVEAAMGEGKTEAALYAIDRALSPRRAHGFYIALPTQATGNALFVRVRAYLEARRHGQAGERLNLQLAHGGSFLSDAFDALRFGPQYDDANGDRSADGSGDGSADRSGAGGRVVAESWFTGRKRPLLAPFGVGTIDQSLLGVLQTKHWFVRLFGLAGKVVVFDEVHAYDVYMSRLLIRLIGWLRRLGCTVILLSATLPASKRRELIRAWAGEDAPEPEAAAYPRVTLVGTADPARPGRAWTVGQTNPPRTIDVSYHALDFAALAATLRQDLPGGGCAALICNTVGRAQEAYRVLKDALAADGWEVSLFHARTLNQWRAATEDQVLSQFGKEGKGVCRPPKALLIATQVVEQSLDLDFDWMASEIAPVDLLLQRMGRLWRHATRTNRAPQPANAPRRFYVVCGDGDNARLPATPPALPPHVEFVYEAYVLYRTRLALAAGKITLPDAIEPLIRQVYEDDPDLAALPDAWRRVLDESRQTQTAQRTEDAKKADPVMVADAGSSPLSVLSPGSGSETENRPVYDDEDPRVHPDVRAATRLGDPSVSVVCFGTDADGAALADPALKAVEPTREQARALLGFAVSISQRGLYTALTDREPPAAWKTSAYLRYHRTLTFTHGECAEVPGYTLRLSRAEGLTIARTSPADAGPTTPHFCEDE